VVYLLHFSEPYKHARHFIGAASNLTAVLDLIYEPARYSRSPLLIAAHNAGVRFQIANLVEGDSRARDRWRARKEAAAICSICREARRGAYAE
jgi:hypothetical protein